MGSQQDVEGYVILNTHEAVNIFHNNRMSNKSYVDIVTEFDELLNMKPTDYSYIKSGYIISY